MGAVEAFSISGAGRRRRSCKDEITFVDCSRCSMRETRGSNETETLGWFPAPLQSNCMRLTNFSRQHPLEVPSKQIRRRITKYVMDHNRQTQTRQIIQYFSIQVYQCQELFIEGNACTTGEHQIEEKQQNDLKSCLMIRNNIFRLKSKNIRINISNKFGCIIIRVWQTVTPSAAAAASTSCMPEHSKTLSIGIYFIILGFDRAQGGLVWAEWEEKWSGEDHGVTNSSWMNKYNVYNSRVSHQLLSDWEVDYRMSCQAKHLRDDFWYDAFESRTTFQLMDLCRHT